MSIEVSVGPSLLSRRQGATLRANVEAAAGTGEEVVVNFGATEVMAPSAAHEFFAKLGPVVVGRITFTGLSPSQEALRAYVEAPPMNPARDPKLRRASDYDSRPDTYAHIAQVRGLLLGAVAELTKRAQCHDNSKLESPEVEAFDEVTPRLAGLTYGSEEYKASLRDLGPALQHHYEANTHHPEHFPEGVYGMDLFDVLEMVADWIAAGRRMKGGSLDESLRKNQERFGYSDEVAGFIERTAETLLAREVR